MHPESTNSEPASTVWRVLGLDIGDRRIGIAVSDPFGHTAQPLLTLGRTHLRKELRDLGRLIRKHDVHEIVAGNPTLPSGDASPQTRKTQAFAEAVRQEFGLPVHLQPETLTSVAAEELLDRRGVPRGPARKAVLDQYAAVIILQDWLDAREAAESAAALCAGTSFHSPDTSEPGAGPE